MFIAALIIGVLIVLFLVSVVVVVCDDVNKTQKKYEKYIHDRDCEIARQDFIIEQLRKDASCKDCKYKRCRYNNTDRCDVFRVEQLAESAEQFMANLPEGE